MKKLPLLFPTLLLSMLASSPLQAKTFIPVNHPNIRYSGRWDTHDSLHYHHSWPGVYVELEFSGTSIGVRMNDSVNYYNVYLDGKFDHVFHPDSTKEADYALASNLASGQHILRLSKRNICFDRIFTLSGFLLDDKAEVLQPPPPPKHKIEFIGDSFTVAESNEAHVQDLPWEQRYPVTNIDEGFAPVIARECQASYNTVCRSGSGLLCNWQGNYDITLPSIYSRALMEADTPAWDFNRWRPDLVVICLGLNDYSGLKDAKGEVSKEKSEAFRIAYRDFMARIRGKYPYVRILAVAAHPAWIRENVKQVVDEERAGGNQWTYYAQFDEFPGGYVVNGHPTVETHHKIADQILQVIKQTPGIFQDQ
jgi:hypothetical protein